MVKSFKFLFQFAWINLGAILCFAAIVIVGCYATGIPAGADNLFGIYFGCFPLMELIMLFLYCSALCTTNLSQGLSFGARRRDFFWAIQGILFLYTAVCWVLQAAMSAIPTAFGWTAIDHWSFLMSMGGQSFWFFPLACLMLAALGCQLGLLVIRSKALGVFLLIVALLIFIAIMVVMLVLPITDLGRFGHYFSAIAAAFMVAVILLCEFFLWRTVNRFVVR